MCQQVELDSNEKGFIYMNNFGITCSTVLSLLKIFSMAASEACLRTTVEQREFIALIKLHPQNYKLHCFRAVSELDTPMF